MVVQVENGERRADHRSPPCPIIGRLDVRVEECDPTYGLRVNPKILA